MIAPAPSRADSAALGMLKAVVFALVGVGLLAGAVWEAAATRSFVARARSATGEVVRLNAGGAHPEVRFIADGGQAVEYPQGGMIWGYHPGDHVTVLYDPRAPAMGPVVDTAGALWGFNAMTFLMGAVFLLGSWSVWRESRGALNPPLPGR